MLPLDLLIFVVVVPASIAAVTVAVAGWAGHRIGAADAGRAAVAVALGAGAIAAQIGIAVPAFPPREVNDWLPWLVLAAMLLGLLESTHPSPAWARWENRLLLAILVLGVVLRPVLGPDWPATWRVVDGEGGLERNLIVVWANRITPSHLQWILGGGLILAVLVVWGNLEALAAGRSTAVLGPPLLVVAASISAALLLSGCIVFGRIGGGLAAALGAVWVLSWWLPDRLLARGGSAVLVTAYAALLIDGHVYSFLPLSSAFLLAAAPLMAWLGFAGPARRLAPWQSSLLAAALALVPGAVAVGLALAASPVYE